MNDFIEHIGNDLREVGEKAKAFLGKLMGKQTTTAANGSVITSTVKTNYEINLVPEVKMQMIKAQKVRNLVLFICIVVSSAAAGAVVILLGVKSGQDIVMASQDTRLETMSKKLNEYNELNSLVTIQGQLDNIDQIIDQKKVVARVFGALGVMLPQGADSVRLSQLTVNVETNIVRMEGQADALVDPLIDYRVLESFKKGVALTKYDYGRYVDADGNLIPTYCISETDKEGNAYKVGDSYYAWWDLQTEGCEASQRGGYTVEGAKYYYSLTAEVEKGIPGQENEPAEGDNSENGEGGEENEGNENEEEVDDERIVPLRVRVWRTPQFTEWLNAGRMTPDGSITNVEHFVSECYTYKGTVTNGTTRWTSMNDCMLAEDGFKVAESANGRDESGNLVLKFTGTTTFAEEFFSFKNKHMIAIGPMGQNVTDSYIQIGGMFTQEATECAVDDIECLDNTNNRGGN